MPSGHIVQLLDLPRENVPSGYAEHLDDSPFEKYTSGQGMHSSCLLEVFVPGGHAIHSLEPSFE